MGGRVRRYDRRYLPNELGCQTPSEQVRVRWEIKDSESTAIPTILLYLKLITHVRRVISTITHVTGGLHVCRHGRVVLGHATLLITPEGVTAQV